VYTYIVNQQASEVQPAAALFKLPCACQNLRRLTRVVTRIYDQELRRAATVGEANQKRLSAGFAMDSTTLTRTLALMRKQGWVRVKAGKDRRERLFSLTGAGRRQMAAAEPYWEQAEQRLRNGLGDAGWKKMNETVLQITEAGMQA
jgi:DNA-binding MarR family transcriptional regulator